MNKQPLKNFQHRLLAAVLVLAGAIAMSLAGFFYASNNTQNLATNIETDKLANGMQIIVIPDQRVPVVTHMVWYKVGAADEPAGKSGIAHYFEHLMFKGTQKRAPSEFSKTVAAHGGQDNAFTSQDYTAYYQRIVADKLAMVMEMEADRMQNLILTDAVTAAERDVVLEERSQRTDSNPAALLGEQMRKRLHRNHPYHVPVIGWRDEIEQLNTKDAAAFYHRYYAPDNALLVVVGDTSMQEVLPLAKKFYGPLKPSGKPRKKRETALPVDGPVTIKRRDARVRQAQWQRLYRLPAPHEKDKRDFAALDLALEILAGGSTSQLHKRLVREAKLAVSIGGYANSVNLDQGEAMFYAVPAEGVSMETLSAKLDDELARFINTPISKSALERAKTQFLASSLYARDSQTTMARIYGAALTLGLSIDDVVNWDNLVADIHPEEVQAAAARFLMPQNSVTGHLLPLEENTQ